MIGDTIKSACAVRKASVFKSGKYDSNTLRVDADFSHTETEKISVFKNMDTCGRALYCLI